MPSPDTDADTDHNPAAFSLSHLLGDADHPGDTRPHIFPNTDGTRDTDADSGANHDTCFISHSGGDIKNNPVNTLTI